MLLMSLGGGVAQAGNAGMSGWSGIAPGIAGFTNALGQQQMLAMQQKRQQEADDFRKRQFAMQESEFADKRAEREQRIKGMGAWAAANDPSKSASVPGMAPPQVPPRIGPQSYDTRTAGLEGGSKNGGMVYNELGSGAFGPYQIMPGTWADIRKNNPDLNLPADITQATRDQHDAAHGRFKAANASALQAAGFQPTPENLYLAHRFGAGGATSLLRSGDDKMLADVLPVDWQRQNPDMRGQSVGGFKRLAGERMQGVGQPYQASGETTQYALQPSSLPAYGGVGMPGFQPGASPSPQFSGRAVAVNGQPPMPQIAQGDNVTVPSAIAAPPPSPPQVPRPMLTSEEYASIKAAATTPKEAEELKNKIVNEKWKRLQDVADKTWQQERDDYRFNRSEATKADQWYTLGQDDPGFDPARPLQRNRRTGETKAVGSGPLVNIDQKGQTEFAKQVGKNDAERLKAIQDAEGTMSDFASKISFAVDQFKQTYTGPAGETANAFFKTLGAFGLEEFANKANAADAGMAMISQMKPHMRAAGSGASSDKDMDMFARALPGLLNLPGGNERVATYFQRLSDRATQVRQIAEVHSEGGTKPLTGTKFADEVKKLGPLFSEDERKELMGVGKAKAAAPPEPPAGYKIVTPKTGGMSPMPNLPPPPPGFSVRP